MKRPKILKIILSGLDNAGKSSAIVSIKNMYEYEEEILALKPTIKIDHFRRIFLKKYELNIMDMGGQQAFRDRYLRRPIYFEEVDCFIYLFDIQTPDRIPESMEYLKDVMNVLDEVDYDKNISIKICFSKMDKEKKYNEVPEYMEIVDKTEKNIKNTFPSFKFDFHKTSIYNIYTIVHVISSGIRNCIEENKQIQELLINFCKDYDLNQILLYEETGLIIGEFNQEIQNFKETFCCSTQRINEIISNNLEYFRKEKEEEDKMFFFKREIGDFIDYGYKFEIKDEVADEKAEPEKFFVSIISHNENPKKEDWNTHELIEKIKSIF
jgi:GTPase SAR1 family protein